MGSPWPAEVVESSKILRFNGFLSKRGEDNGDVPEGPFGGGAGSTSFTTPAVSFSAVSVGAAAASPPAGALAG